MPNRERTKLSMPFTNKMFWHRTYKWDRKNWYHDHVGFKICQIFGHGNNIYSTGEYDYKACKRCCRYILSAK